VKSRSISRQPRRKVARRGARWRAGKVPVKRSSRVGNVSAALFIYGRDAGLLAEQATGGKPFSETVWNQFSRTFSNRAQPLKNRAVAGRETAQLLISRRSCAGSLSVPCRVRNVRGFPFSRWSGVPGFVQRSSEPLTLVALSVVAGLLGRRSGCRAGQRGNAGGWPGCAATAAKEKISSRWKPERRGR